MSLLLKVQQEHSIDFKIDFSIFPNQKSCLSELLPYDPTTKNKKELQIGLKEYQMLLNISLKALNAFKQKELEKFDSLVGENACQIRAVKTALLATKNSVDFNELEKEIIKNLSIIDQLLQPSKIASLMLSLTSLKNVLEEENLLLSLSHDQKFLILSYILTEAKEVNSDERKISFLCIRNLIGPKKLKKFGNVSSNFAENLVRKARKLLSIASVHFVQDLAMIANEESLRQMTSPMFTKKHLNCLCIPMFWAYKTIFITIQKEKIPIIIHAKFVTKSSDGTYEVIDEDHLFFEPTDNAASDAFVEKSLAEIDPNRPAFIVQGVVVVNENEPICKNKWKTRMTSSSIKNVILAGAADHRQYPEEAMDEMITSIKINEFENFKDFAEHKGFSLKNPTTFFIQHVYSALAGNFLKVN